MSVAEGMAQPLRFSGSFQLSATKIAAGTIMPPSAAIPGSARRDHVASCPSRSSRLISRPTRRKKTAISASLIQCRTDRPKTYRCSTSK